jgi:hypothetical protein
VAVGGCWIHSPHFSKDSSPYGIGHVGLSGIIISLESV